MPKTEDVLAVVGEWVQKADNDLKNAAHAVSVIGFASRVAHWPSRRGTRRIEDGA